VEGNCCDMIQVHILAFVYVDLVNPGQLESR
jgi:hypothetical protein